MLLWSGMLFTLPFCSLFTVIFPWLWLGPVLCCELSCVSLVLFPVGTLFNCSLLVYVCYVISDFQIVLECLLQDLSFCVCLTDPGDITQVWFVLSLHACCSWWLIFLSCYMYCVWSVVMVMVSFSNYCTLVSWSTFFSLDHYSIPYWNKIIISGGVMVLIFLSFIIWLAL